MLATWLVMIPEVLTEQSSDDNSYCRAVTALKGTNALSRLIDANRLNIQDVAAEVFPNGH